MKTKQAFILVIAVGVLLPAIAGFRLFHIGNWATGAHRVEWVYGDGAKITPNPDETYPWVGCKPNDVGLNTFRHDNALWTTCNTKTFGGNTGFARIDPAKGLGTVWRFPDELPHLSTAGLAVGPDQQVAVVYRVGKFEGEKALGILDKDNGWIFGPQKLPESRGARLLAVSWVSGELVLIYRGNVYSPESAKSDERLLWIVTIDGQKINAREIKRPEMPGNNYYLLCKVFFADGQWQVTISAPKTKKTYVIKEDGTYRVAKDYFDCFNSHGRSELAAVGLTYISPSVSLRSAKALEQTIDGVVAPLRPPPVDTWHPIYTYSWLDGTKGGLKRCPQWNVSDDGWKLARPLDAGWLALETLESNDNLVAHLLDANGKAHLTRVIARSPSYNCGRLITGVPIPKEGKEGFWLVSQSGCYVSVGEDLRRLDPLPLLEHLRSRGSLCPEWNEWGHIVAFFWVLFGLPACLAVSFIMVRLKHIQLYAALCYGGGFFIASGGWALFRVFPLLQ